MTKVTTYIINGFVLFSLALILTHGWAPLEIKSRTLMDVAFWGLLIAPPVALIWNLFYFRTLRKKALSSILPLSVIAFLASIGFMNFLFAMNPYQTQDILYQHAEHEDVRIEFQMQDVGALGYNRRRVIVEYYTPLFMITHPLPDGFEPEQDWIPVNEFVNELGIKFP
ncbi:MAG: hypothetical protein HWD92_07400 [Flavobacteriia bacterium]|nr:hypothetical protein [Flavobacteriia bacterium]